jgi:DNA-binding LytR/AlgR family response regulator
MHRKSPANDDPGRFWQVHHGTIVNVDAASGVMREDAEK